MAENLKLVCVRLEPPTLHLLDALTEHPERLTLYNPHRRISQKFTRSSVLRLAIELGLETLTVPTSPQT